MSPEDKNRIPEDDFYEYKVFQADPGQEPLRVDKFLMDRMFNVSRNRIQNAIRAGAVTVDGQFVKPNYKVKPFQEVEVTIPKPPYETDHVIPQNIDINVVYEDDDLMVVHKDPGMVVHPGVGHRKGTLVNALAGYFERTDLPVMRGNPGNRMGLVHRIDKDTSGLLLIAKTEFAMSHLAKQFMRHTIHRRYQAIIWGQPDAESGTIEKNLGRHPRFRKLMTTFEEPHEGKRAVTHWKMLEPLYYVSLVECRLETGRTHQIRVHMKHLGHPLFNDERYGGDQIVKGTIYSKYKTFVEGCFKTLPRQALHAKELGFVHPTTGKEMFFDSELPQDMTECLARWRKYVNAKRSQKGYVM